MDGLNDTQRYFVEEHIEDFRDGLIARRELIRRVAIVVGSAAAATTLLAACDLSPRSTGTPTPTVTASTSPGLVAQPFATPPPAATTDGITVMENDPRIAVSRPEIKGADGASLMAYVARPIVSAPGMDMPVPSASAAPITTPSATWMGAAMSKPRGSSRRAARACRRAARSPRIAAPRVRETAGSAR